MKTRDKKNLGAETCPGVLRCPLGRLGRRGACMQEAAGIPTFLRILYGMSTHLPSLILEPS